MVPSKEKKTLLTPRGSFQTSRTTTLSDLSGEQLLEARPQTLFIPWKFAVPGK